ncbi:MAG: cupin domain-containing protein [Holdemanella sp.]|nr:cupin domain-containing protein [Holdemanella sp.]
MEHFNGGEGTFHARMIVDEHNKILLGRLEPGNTIGFHQHSGTSEIIFVEKGVGTIVVEDGEEIVLPGQCHYCPEGKSHSLQNRGSETLIFKAVVPVHK